MKLDLACGKRKRDGFTGVDIVAIDGVDIVHDLTQFPWPFDDGSVEEVFCSHYIEHTPDFIAFMNELYRIMEVGGSAVLMAPYYNSMGCWQDPTHKRAISENSFAYFIKDWLDRNGLSHYGIEANFDVMFEYQPNQDFMKKNDEAKDGKVILDWAVVGTSPIVFSIPFAIKHLTNTMDNIVVKLVKKPMMVIV